MIKTVMTMMVCASLFAGCGSDPEDNKDQSARTAQVPDGVLVSTPPPGAARIPAVKAAAKVGDEVVIRGRAGGQRDGVFNDAYATAMLVDIMTPITCSLDSACGCKTPWDYCCGDKKVKRSNTALVRLTDAKGKTLPGTLKGVGGLDYFSLVTVRGKISRISEGGDLVIDATELCVEPKGELKRGMIGDGGRDYK